jgi:hypothetical protein
VKSSRLRRLDDKSVSQLRRRNCLEPAEGVVAETLVQFTSPVVGPDGRAYLARACGSPAADGLWHGWIEFTPADGGDPIQSGRETTQPNRKDAVYWATGLSTVYLEGALQRAITGPIVRPVAIVDPPAFQTPPASTIPAAPGGESSRHAILDPFAVFPKGETLLRKQLMALSPWHLVNIVRDYELSSEPDDALDQRSHSSLADLIVSAVKQRLGSVTATSGPTPPPARSRGGASR